MAKPKVHVLAEHFPATESNPDEHMVTLCKRETFEAYVRLKEQPTCKNCLRRLAQRGQPQ